MGVFDLPTHWVYVHYEDGTVKNVANSDYLNAKEALEYKTMWDKSNNKVIEVSLRTNDDVIVRWYKF